MLATLRRLLAPPTFEGDEDKTRTARLMLQRTAQELGRAFGAARTTIKLKVKEDQEVPNG